MRLYRVVGLQSIYFNILNKLDVDYDVSPQTQANTRQHTPQKQRGQEMTGYCALPFVLFKTRLTWHYYWYYYNFAI